MIKNRFLNDQTQANRLSRGVVWIFYFGKTLNSSWKQSDQRQTTTFHKYCQRQAVGLSWVIHNGCGAVVSHEAAFSACATSPPSRTLFCFNWPSTTDCFWNARKREIESETKIPEYKKDKSWSCLWTFIDKELGIEVSDAKQINKEAKNCYGFQFSNDKMFNKYGEEVKCPIQCRSVRF